MDNDPLTQRRNERKVYEEVVNLVVDYVSKEFSDEAARLRIYTLVADNFKGMVKALKPPTRRSTKSIMTGVENAVE